MKATTKRDKIKLSQKYSEMNFWLSSLKDTKELFHAYDIELSDFLQQLEIAVGESKALDSENIESEEKAISTPREKENFKKIENNEESFEESERKVQNKSCPSWMKKAFKAIAIKTHPDKVLFREDLSEFQKEELIKKYSLAAEAISLSSGISLLEIAQSLDIELDLSAKEQILMLKNKIKKLKSEIDDHQSMVSWNWGENEGNISARVNLIVYVRSFLKKSNLNADLLKKFVERYENDEKLFEKNNNRDKILPRKIGTRPHPRISKLRKK